MSTQVENRRVFLSYNAGDVAVARSDGAHLTLAGVEVWFDEWRIKAGDSIPGRLNEGLEGFDDSMPLSSCGLHKHLAQRGFGRN